MYGTETYKGVTMLVRTDDTDAFGNLGLLRLTFSVPTGQTVSKIIIYCADLVFTFVSPVSPIILNLTQEQTKILKDNNCYSFEFYDGNNKKLSITNVASFKTKERAAK